MQKDLKQEMQKVWDYIDQDISGRLFDHPLYSLTSIRHGIRCRFNEYLGIDQELEDEFHGRKEPNPTIIVIDTLNKN